MGFRSWLGKTVGHFGGVVRKVADFGSGVVRKVAEFAGPVGGVAASIADMVGRPDVGGCDSQRGGMAPKIRSAGREGVGEGERRGWQNEGF